MASRRFSFPRRAVLGLGRSVLHGPGAVGNLLPHLLLRPALHRSLPAGSVLVPAAAAGNRLRDPPPARTRHARPGDFGPGDLRRSLHHGTGAITPPRD